SQTKVRRFHGVGHRRLWCRLRAAIPPVVLNAVKDLVVQAPRVEVLRFAQDDGAGWQWGPVEAVPYAVLSAAIGSSITGCSSRCSISRGTTCQKCCSSRSQSTSSRSAKR